MIFIHPEAAAEAGAARFWYAERNTATGERFLAEYDRAISRISETPLRWPAHPQVEGYRCYHLRRFPYSVVYEVMRDAVHVLAVAHDRRRPGYWRKRAAP